MTFSVIYLERAQADLVNIYRFVRRSGASQQTAQRYVDDIKRSCDDLRDYPERGTKRDELMSGLRTFGHKRRVTVLFRVASNYVYILRVLYGGRDVGRALRGLR